MKSGLDAKPLFLQVDMLRKLLREGNQIWYTCNSPTFGNIGVICYSKKFFLAGDGRWSF